MSSILRVAKFVNSPRGLIPAVGVEGTYHGRNEDGLLVVRFTPPFRTAIGTTALPDERYDYVEIYFLPDEVELVSADADFDHSALDIRTVPPLKRIDHREREMLALWINLHGDGRIGTATEHNLEDFPLDYAQDCLRTALRDERFGAEMLRGVADILARITDPEPEPRTPRLA